MQKLRLSLTELPTAMKDQMSTKFPKGNPIDIFSDFVNHLFESVKELFQAEASNGEAGCSSVSSDVELVLTHLNGWGGPQQTRLRNAAVKASIGLDTPAGHSGAHFLTGSEFQLEPPGYR